MKDKRKIIFSYKTTLLYIFLFLVWESIVFKLFRETTGNFLLTIKYMLAFWGVCFIFLIFKAANYILYTDDIVIIVDEPFWDTNKVINKYSGVMRTNSCVFIEEVEKVELVRLSLKEKRQFVGHRHLWSRYLKVHIKNSSTKKYIYVFGYSWWQIRKIKRILLQKCENR